MAIQRALVTGGCGFIGSHVVDALVARGASVVVVDNLKTGFEKHIADARSKGDVTYLQRDLTVGDALDGAIDGVDTVFHFAANADVRGGMHDTWIDLEQNVIATRHVLEACRQQGVKTFAFASSATVYGDPAQFPTPEDCPKVQTSLYGASKLASEAMAEAFAEYYGLRAVVFRFVSWIGERYSHGVVFDFINKLRADPSRLEILGDGSQQKSYLHVDDGIAGIFAAIEKGSERKAVYNIGHDYTVNVKAVADIVKGEMGLPDARYDFTGGDRGWLGDSPVVHLDTVRLKSLGWTPQVTIESGLQRTARYLLENPWLLASRG